MAKAQIEIIGLMLILILLSLGMLFAIKYVFLSPAKEIKAEYTEKNIAENMLYAVLETDVECNNNYISIKDLLIDCKESVGVSLNCNGYSSCNFAKENINQIFKKTLEKWGNKYYFQADTIKINELCVSGKKTGIQSFNLATGIFEISLEICD